MKNAWGSKRGWIVRKLRGSDLSMMPTRRGARAVLLLGVLLIATRSRAGSVTFNRDVRPILSEHCFSCHGPDAKARKAGLRLDQESSARAVLKSGHTAIIPGRPEASELIGRITAADTDDRMPPAETKKPLTTGDIDVLKAWVAEGATYEGHWAYIPPVRPAPPPVQDPDWPRNAVDRFVLARIEKAGLKPSPEASKEKLLRRVSLDLTGLPPTVEELDAFLADTGDKAYEKVVDRLLASPHYGERMAQQWLDLARYGETQGYHHDRHRDMWHWRDWVINAFNANMPFDEFTTEQLAGDLLPDPTRDQLIATGFHRNEMTTSEGGALPEEYLVKYAVGRVDTTARVWLGTSMACAECHDHKFDPITQKEYYQFFAFFYDTPENGLDQEERNPVPRITLETAEQREHAAQLDKEVSALEAAESLVMSADREPWDRAQADWEEHHRAQTLGGWQALKLLNSRVSRPGGLVQTADHALQPVTPKEDRVTYDVTLQADARGLNGLRLEVLPPPQSTEATTGRFVLEKVEADIRSLDPSRDAGLDESVVQGPWFELGPFHAGSTVEAFDRDFGPEKGVDLEATFHEGKTRWRGREPGGDDGHFAIGGTTNDAAYVTKTLTVPSARILEARVAFQGGVKAWVNGRSVVSRKAGTSPAREGERVLLWLRPGENRVLLKLIPGETNAGVDFRILPDAVSSVPLEWTAAVADVEPDGPEAKVVLDGAPGTGWTVPRDGQTHSVLLQAAEAFGFSGGTAIHLRLAFRGVLDSAPPAIRVSATTSDSLREFVGLPKPVRAALFAPAGSLTTAQRMELRRFYRQHDIPEAAEARRMLEARRKERDDYRNAWPTAMVMREAHPTRETHILIRGQYNQLGEKVEPGVPSHLFAWRDDLPRNRLGLARWLVDPGHPLTSRVIVNQYWQKYFGIGLVKTSEDFGSQGDWPTHPALLDWLATEFVRTGWDIKALQRMIVTSATYRQDSVVSPDLLERDPDNRLLARGPRFRLDAENIRDVAMAASGLLNPRVGGPSVFPYQPPGLWAQVSFEGTRDYVQSVGADNYRRGLYTYWRRSIPYASYTIFDAPSHEVCVMRRPRTNTPLQSLALMNDPVYVEAARALGDRIMREGGSNLDQRIRRAFRLLLARAPSPREISVMSAAFDREFRRFARDREAANRLIHTGASAPPVDVDIAELAAWTVVADTLLNLDETITKS